MKNTKARLFHYFKMNARKANLLVLRAFLYTFASIKKSFDLILTKRKIVQLFGVKQKDNLILKNSRNILLKVFRLSFIE